MTPADPFAPASTRMAVLAARAGCTEGQLWSLAIATVAVVGLLSAALPGVTWHGGDEFAGPSVAAESRPEVEPGPSEGAQRTLADVPALGPLQTPLTAAPLPLRGDPAEVQPAAPVIDGPATPPLVGRGQAPDSPPRQLHVIDGGYASASAGTLLAGPELPDGVLAVSLRGGRPHEVAYVRLGGAGTELTLRVSEEPGANLLDALAGLMACPVLEDGWQLGDGDTRLEDAPAYDCSSPAPATRSADGTSWTFDLSMVDDPARPAGFALVPDTDAPSPMFRVSLLRSSEKES